MKQLLVLLVGAVLVFTFELLVIKWFMSLFRPTSWTEALVVALIISMIGAAVRRSRK